MRVTYQVTIEVADDTTEEQLDGFAGVLAAQAEEPVGSVDEWGNEDLIESTRYEVRRLPHDRPLRHQFVLGYEGLGVKYCATCNEDEFHITHEEA